MYFSYPVQRSRRFQPPLHGAEPAKQTVIWGYLAFSCAAASKRKCAPLIEVDAALEKIRYGVQFSKDHAAW